jgi:hypothetical protein
MANVLLHDDLVIEDQVVYVTGHAYRKCKFNRCTFYLRDLSGVFDHCDFNSCVWHLDLLLHDRDQVPALEQVVGIVRFSLNAGPGLKPMG